MKATMIEYPDDSTWLGVKERALVTVGKHAVTPPTDDWKHRILAARHSPIRHIQFSFYIEDIPYWVSVHLCRHVIAQPYVKTQRNDRQKEYDRNEAPQNAPVNMIWDMNAEELMTIANKRLCHLASPETRQVVSMMCAEVQKVCPEFKGLLVPSCVYNGGICHEMFPCEMQKAREAQKEQKPISE